MPETVGLNVKFTGDSSGVVEEARQGERALDRYGNEVTKTGVKSKKFAKDVDSGTSALKQFGSGLATVAKGAALAGAAIATGATVALARMVKTGLESADALGKVSDKLGVATESLAGLRVAAERSGVAAQQFDTALQRLVRRTAEAAQGTGEAKGALEKLGLSAQQLVKLAPDQILGRVADAMQGVESQSQRVALAFKLFDTEGVALVNTLASGSAGLDSFQERAKVAGVALSRDMVASVERANDAMADLDLLQQGLSQQLAVKFAPVLEGISKRLFEIAEESGGMGKVAEKVFNFLIDGAAKVASAIDAIRVVWDVLKATTLSVASVIASALENIASTAATVIGFFNEGHAKEFADVSIALSITQRDLANDAAAAWESAGKAVANFGKTGERLRLELGKLERAGTKAFENTRKAVDETEDSLADVGKTSTEVEEIVITGWDRVSGSIIGAADTMAQANESAAARSANAWGQAGSQMAAIFGSFGGIGALGGGSFGGGFSTNGALQSIFGSGFTGATAAGAQGGFGSALGGFGTGVLGGLGGLYSNASGGLSQLSVGFLGQNNVVQNALGGQFSNFNTTGQAFGLNGSAATGAGALANAGLGVAGAYGGTKIGESLFGKQANSSIGATAGGVVGSFFGPWGTLIGSALGGLADAAFGGDGQKRFVAGVDTGSSRNRPNAFADVVGASGLRLRGVENRAGDQGQEAANALLQTLGSLDQALTGLSAAAGVGVDFRNVTLAGRSGQAGDTGAGGFFGAFGFNGELEQGSGITGAADEFVKAWLDQINGQLPKNVQKALKGADQTAEGLITAFEDALVKENEKAQETLEREAEKQAKAAQKAAEDAQKAAAEAIRKAAEAANREAVKAAQGTIRSLLDLDVVNRNKEAVNALGVANRTALQNYHYLTEATITAAHQIDSSAESYENLTGVLQQQKAAAAELAVAYRSAATESLGLLKNTRKQIQETGLSEKVLYELRQREIGALTTRLSVATDPQRITELSGQIADLVGNAFSLLGEDQQAKAKGGFVELLRNTEDLARSRTDLGLARLGQREAGVGNAVALESLGGASKRFSDASDKFAKAVDRINTATRGSVYATETRS